MNYKTKCEIVERLKKNKFPYCFLNDMEKEVLGSFGSHSEHIGSLDWDSSFSFGENNGGCAMAVYRIHRDYVVPIEVPKGYRLVTKEDEADCPYPEDVVVMWFNSFHGWNKSRDSLGWGEADGVANAFAVPEDYSFEPETVQMTVEEICKLVGKNVEIVKQRRQK